MEKTIATSPPFPQKPFDHEHHRKIENLHIYLWLLKDMCWCLDYKTLGMIMIVPTVIGAIVITGYQRKNAVDLIHNLAVCLWIFANATWMTGEFFYEDKTRPYATVFFIAGLLILTIYYAKVVIDKFSGRTRVGSKPTQ